MTDTRRLSPEHVATDLFTILIDRDQRASAVCAETLLMLAANNYAAPANSDELVSPKRRRFAIRSLALGHNFLRQMGEGRAGDDEMTPHRFGELLSRGEQIRGSANLHLAQDALQGLLDPSSQRGQIGTWLLFPFHESLLWYDARPNGRIGPWGVRKVYMRGSGITLARMLADAAIDEARPRGKNALLALREALRARSPLADIADVMEHALAEEFHTPPEIERDEQDAWEQGASPKLAALTGALCRHAEGIMLQGGASAPARLWQLRTMLGFDVALHALRVAWTATNTARRNQYLLLSFRGAPRAADRVRQHSESTYQLARIQISEATILTLATGMKTLVEQDARQNWRSEFGPRSADRIHDVIDQLAAMHRGAGIDVYQRLARSAAAQATYGRAGEGFRVLFESVGVLAGTGRYRYLTATPDLLSALVGALSEQMPMTSGEFFRALFNEWGIVITQESAAETAAADYLDGAELERNGRRAERLMADTGLAISLSDRTTLVGERARRDP